MRRRLTLTIVGLVAAALVVTGLGTLALAHAAARRATVNDLQEQAVTLSTAVEGLQQKAVLAAMVRALRLEGAGIVAVPTDTTTLAGRLAARRAALAATGPVGGVTLSPSELDALRTGTPVVSGWRGGVAYAAAPVARAGTPVSLAVVLTRRQASGFGVALPWFLVSAGAALAVAAAAADRLSRRFARPVSDAADAARRIAGGDLAVRVTAPAAEEELARLASSINTMAAELERARGLQRQFLLSVSHELRTPLTSVRGFAEAIADGAAPDTRRAAEVIGAEARRLERLVGDLLDLAKLDARAFSLHLEAVDVGEVVTRTTEGFRPAAASAGLSLEVDGAGGLVASADPERLAQIVANLVENALKFATATITVSATAGEGGVVVAVTDDGPGMDAEDLPHVFDRLYQTRRPVARQAGSGLGLAIVAELAAAMGARVEARSRPGATRMEVRLPAG
ncbi:MAG TPA: HAMP domain-containing sensor histidine kinase [Dermatophilaceae bacterium]|nr:HAMP domain-containing sensor histidine kinase [Dermatophilaceae bacterium]